MADHTHGGPVRYRFAYLLVLLVSACDGPSVPADGGPDGSTFDGSTSPDGGGGDTGPVCSRASDCDDGLYCNGTETCSPGAAGAAANGCVAGMAPCSTGEMCDETSSSCLSSECPSDPSMRDADGDGHETMACPGGDDCDDTDGNRFPGNTEVCPGGGDPLDTHDEDCDSSTVGDLDADSDTYVSAVCCNGDTCGPDCDDSNGSVHPNAGEVCNGVDDDCNGIVDDSTAMPLCPGGLCLSGSCRIDSWSESSAPFTTITRFGADIDTSGRVVVVSRVSGTIDFGGPPPAPTFSDGLVVVGYGADGTYGWNAPIQADNGGSDLVSVCSGLATPFTPTAGVVTDASGNVYVAACCSGGGMMQSTVQSFGPDGTSRWTYTLYDGCGGSIDITPSGTVLVGGYAKGTTDLGGGAAASHAAMLEDGFVLELDASDGSYGAAHWVGGANNARVMSVAARPTGTALGIQATKGTATTSNVCFNVGSTMQCESGSFGALVALSSAWAVDWEQTIGTTVNAVACAPDGRIVAGALFGGTLSIGGPALTSTPSHDDGVLASFDASGAYQWQRHLASPGVVSVNDVDIAADGTAAVTGAFSQTVTLAGTPSGAGRTDRDLYAAWYGSDGSEMQHVVAGASGNDDSLAIAIGAFRDTAYGGTFLDTVDLGDGTYTSAGLGDAFVVRTTY